MKLDGHKLREVTRNLCERDFRFFVAYFFRVRKRSNFIFNDHHDLMISDAVDVAGGHVQNLIENVPPRYSKTEIFVVMFVAWCYARNPKCEFIHLSYSDQLVMDNSDAIKNLMKSREYQRLWPTVRITNNRDSKGAWGTVQGGTFLATTPAGALTGFGAGRMDEYDEATGVFTFSGCLLIDDALKPDDARYDTPRKNTNRRWIETIKSRRNSPRTPTICIMQRIHQDDFTAELLRDKALRWMHRRLPALIDEGLPTERALWPAKHSVEALKDMRDAVNDRGQPNPVARETFASQMQQDPAPEGGGLVREEWWRFYNSWQEARNRCTFFFITADTAYTESQANDPSALQLWGAEGRQRLYLLDRVRGFWEFPELMKVAAAFVAKHPYAKRVYIENKASGASLAQMLRKHLRGARRPLTRDAAGGTQILLWKPKTYRFPEDKVGRVKFATTEYHAGNVWLPNPDAPGFFWCWEFIDEHSAFTETDTHAHDEDVDCATMAVSVWTRHGGGVRGKANQQATT